MLTANILKSARHLLGWSQEDLASQSNLSIGTIKRVESISGEISANPSTIKLLLLTFKQNNLIITANSDTTTIILKNLN